MARRGENIRKRSDGRWEGRYIKGRTPEGRPLWGYVYGATYAEVREISIRKKAEYGFYHLSGKTTLFAELAQLWLCSLRQGVKESTFAHYQYTLQHYLLPVFGAMPLHTLDECVLEQGMLAVLSPSAGSHKPLGAASARECLTMLRRICAYAERLRLIRPLTVTVKLPQKKPPALQPLSAAEQKTLQAFVLAAPTPRKVGLLLGAQLGLRIGELCGLQWGDFDLSAGTVQICRTVSRISCGNGHTKVVVQSPKTSHSARTLPLPKTLLRVLRQLHGSVCPETWFLSGTAEKPVEPRCYRKSIRGYLKKAAVPPVRPHALRHTFATTCLQAGCDLKTLSELLGHANAAIALQRYVHSDMERKRREIDRIFRNG